MTEVCRVCKAPTTVHNLLHYCTSEACGSVHWDKPAVKKQAKLLRENMHQKKEFLLKSRVPLENLGGHFVYQLRLRKGQKSVYIGMTGLHPHHRYLNHIIGYKASSRPRKYATALISFEGPMKYEKAVKREVDWANELRELGYDVHGGH